MAKNKQIKYIKLPPSDLGTAKTPDDQALHEFLDKNKMHLVSAKSYGKFVPVQEDLINSEDIYALSVLQNCVTCGQVLGNYAENCSDTVNTWDHEDNDTVSPNNRVRANL